MADKQNDNGLGNPMMNPDERNTPIFESRARCFEIHFKGHLNYQWSDWLEGMELKLMDNGESVLSGHIIDQAALMGMLNLLNRFNLTLLSVKEVKEE